MRSARAAGHLRRRALEQRGVRRHVGIRRHHLAAANGGSARPPLTRSGAGIAWDLSQSRLVVTGRSTNSLTPGSCAASGSRSPLPLRSGGRARFSDTGVMRAFLVGFCLLLCACPPPAGRALGDPSGRSKRQDQGNEQSLGIAFDMPDAGAGAFSVLAANVGNIDVLRCDSALYKLCDAAQEARITAAIARAKPDVALLSELITPAQCEALADLVDEGHVCHPSRRAQEPDQARRMLGPGYTISCEPRRGYECIAVRVGFASIEGCAEGKVCRGLSRTATPVAGCDDGFTLSAVTAKFDGTKLDLIVAHPPSGAMPENKQCRAAFLPAALDEAGSLRTQPRVILGGDFNMDPYRKAGDADVAYWRSRVRFEASASGPALVMHSGLTENDPPFWSAPLNRQTWDHVLSTGFVGRCLTLGAADGFPALDAPQGEEIHRLDHLAQYCLLSAQP